ncbi:MAG: hypothetical protein WCI45_03895 [Desulfuromonadales bacterium]
MTIGNGLDYSRIAYKLTAVTELIGSPEEARELTRDTYSGIRILLEESAEMLLSDENRQGYKLLTVAALMGNPEECEQISNDTWSGARLIVEDVTGCLLNA